VPKVEPVVPPVEPVVPTVEPVVPTVELVVPVKVEKPKINPFTNGKFYIMYNFEEKDL
jgi:hypothetical protein